MGKVKEAGDRFFSKGSPVAWMTGLQYREAKPSERLVAWMDSQVGAKENGKPNHGEDVAEYLKACGLGQGNPWCAALVTWCSKKAGTVVPGFSPAAVRSWAAMSQRRREQPARGRLFYWLSAKGTGHIGVCLGPAVLGVFRTIEGNTNDEGGRDGDRCHKRTRTLWGIKRNHKWGFLDVDPT